MDRRTYLGLASGAVAGLAGCLTSPAPDPASSQPCPALLDADRTVCPGDADRSLSVDRTPAVVSRGDWTLEIAITNRAEPCHIVPTSWSLYRQVDDRWRPVVARGPAGRRVVLGAGDRYAWQLCTAGAGMADADRRIVLSVAPGTYAFALPVRTPVRIDAVAAFTVGN